MEARAWLLLLSGEPVEAIRMLLLSCTWESSVQFCEAVVDRSKLLLKQDGETSESFLVRTPTLLFEEMLSYCLATHASPRMLEQVWPLIPDTYTIDQLLACITPSGQQPVFASGSAASFGAMKDIIKNVEARFRRDMETYHPST